jgi:hypothetical protein
VSHLDEHTIRRFWSKVTVAGATECWLWTTALDRYGYGRFYNPLGSPLPHRVAYELLIGPIPDGLQLDHLCRVRACVNPSHLEPVTPATNTKRGWPAQKTHCLHGHPLDQENTYLRTAPSGGKRMCRACNRIAVSSYKARKAAAA